MASGQTGSKSKCPVLWAVLKDAAGKDAAARWVRASGQGWGAATGSTWGRAGANAWHHHADEAAPRLCQAPWAAGTQQLSPPHSTKSRTPQGGGAVGAGSAHGHGDKRVPPLALSGALPVPLLPDAWHTGHCQLGLFTAGQAPSLGAGAAAPSTRRVVGAPWHQFGSVGNTWDAPAPAPACSGSEQGQSHCGGHRAEGGGQPHWAAPGLPLPPALGSEASALVVQPAELGEATVPAVRIPAGTPCQSPAPRPAAPATTAAAGAAAAGAAAAAPVLVDGDLDLGPAKDQQ